MTLTVKIRLPRTGPDAADPRELLRVLLPIVEPTALVVAEAVGAGLLGQIVCAAALRSARKALGA